MLTIENYKAIQGIQMRVKGYNFMITEVRESRQMYVLTLEHMGTTFAPFTVSLSRSSKNENPSENYKYIFRKNGDNPCYVYITYLKTKRDFVNSLTDYLKTI